MLMSTDSANISRSDMNDFEWMGVASPGIGQAILLLPPVVTLSRHGRDEGVVPSRRWLIMRYYQGLDYR